jgi:hypothetical protein
MIVATLTTEQIPRDWEHVEAIILKHALLGYGYLQPTAASIFHFRTEQDCELTMPYLIRALAAPGSWTVTNDPSLSENPPDRSFLLETAERFLQNRAR